jgi:hypothetical protein
MIRILLISYYFPPCNASGSRRWGNIFEQLRLTKNVDVKVLAPNWYGSKKRKDVFNIGPIIYYTPPKSIIEKKNFINTLKHPSEYFRSISYETIFGNWKNLAKNWIDENLSLKFDIIITSFSPISSILVGNYAKLKFKSKLVIDLRDLISLQGQKIKIPFIHQIDKYLDKFFCRNADLILTIGKTNKEKAKKLYNKPIHIIYNTNKSKITKIPKIDLNKSIDIGYFGTIGYNRDPKKIINILSDFLNKFKDHRITLHFASNDNPYNYIVNLNNFSSLLNIKFYGYLHGKKLNALYKKCDFYLLLEDQSPNGIENLTGKIFDYMSKSKPIIASCHRKSDILGILNYTTCGMLVSSLNDFELFLKKVRANYFYSKINNINEFSTKEQSDKLVQLLKLL